MLALSYNPQDLEESKDDMRMSERVFLEAKGLEDDKRLAIRQFETDKA
jgi:hypothetical protein